MPRNGEDSFIKFKKKKTSQIHTDHFDEALHGLT